MESELSVRDVLTKEYVGVSESDTVRGAVELMREERSGCVLVVRGSDPVGILTEWDVLGLVADGIDPGGTSVGEVMSSPVLSVEPTRPLTDAADTMAKESVRNLVVENDDGVLGILTQRDVIAAAGSFTGTTKTRAEEPAVGRGATVSNEVDAVANGGDEYTTQGVCEACGSLADALWESNGRLLCSDCRTV